MFYSRTSFTRSFGVFQTGYYFSFIPGGADSERGHLSYFLAQVRSDRCQPVVDGMPRPGSPLTQFFYDCIKKTVTPLKTVPSGLCEDKVSLKTLPCPKSSRHEVRMGEGQVVPASHTDLGLGEAINRFLSL